MMKNKVYGIISLECINSNWNADFNKEPKMDGKGNYKGSPFALEYTIKKVWDNRGEKVLGLRSYSKEMTVNTLDERFKSLFENTKDVKELMDNLLKCKDVKNFGVVFAPKSKEDKKDKNKLPKANVSLQGVVQIADGLNKYQDTELTSSEYILSPYASDSNKTMVTNGVRITVDEAHYLYPVTVSPNELQVEGIEYTEEDYEDFKQTALKAVSLYNSKSKVGCNNEFAIFVKIKEENNYIIALGDLTRYVKVYKDEDEKTVVYDLVDLEELLNSVADKIEDIEIYYRNRLNKIIGFENTKLNLKKFNIITGKEF